jgi:hypothetical protein
VNVHCQQTFLDSSTIIFVKLIFIETSTSLSSGHFVQHLMIADAQNVQVGENPFPGVLQDTHIHVGKSPVSIQGPNNETDKTSPACRDSRR